MFLPAFLSVFTFSLVIVAQFFGDTSLCADVSLLKKRNQIKFVYVYMSVYVLNLSMAETAVTSMLTHAVWQPVC